MLVNPGMDPICTVTTYYIEIQYKRMIECNHIEGREYPTHPCLGMEIVPQPLPGPFLYVAKQLLIDKSINKKIAKKSHRDLHTFLCFSLLHVVIQRIVPFSYQTLKCLVFK